MQEWELGNCLIDSLGKMITVGIAADCSLYRDCLKRVLRNRTDIEVGVTAGTAEPWDSLAREVTVVLVDHASSGAQSTVRHVSAMQDGPPTVVYGVPKTEHHIIEYFEAGAAAVVLSHDTVGDLVEAIKGALRNEVYCRPGVAAILAKRVYDIATEAGTSVSGSTLTERELDVMELLDKGFSNKAIARRLGIKVATVKTHVHSILAKLNVNRRGEAAALLHGRLRTPTPPPKPKYKSDAPHHLI